MMKSPFNYLALLALLLFAQPATADTYIVASQQAFDSAHDNAMMNDSIIWETGTFANIYMNISKSHLFVGAAVLGGTVFNGTSRVRVSGDYVTLEGVQFVGGNIGSLDVINIYGSYGHYHQINIRAYTCYKYLRIREQSQYVNVTYCNFENRLNLDDQNILSILVDNDQPGYHKIQHCSFKNFDGTGNDMGIEPIRIGLSSQADRISRSLVEYCYFTNCDGDGEIISSKATQTVYRFNTFAGNSKAELVLRHGSEAIVYGNFFLSGKGGIRVREGQHHYIYNNYFYDLADRAIFLQNDDSDPLDNINIAFNTIVDCDEVRLGGNGPDQPTNVTLANNIFTDPDNTLFDEPTGTETWIGNIAFGSLGMPVPASGLTVVDPLLVANSEGFFGLAETSPAIDAALPGFATLPQFPGMDPIDTDILEDLMGQARPSAIGEKDLGCNEYPHDILIQPIATEENTGPSYNTSPVTSVRRNTLVVDKLITVSPNPATSQITINLELASAAYTTIGILDLQGRKMRTIVSEATPSGQQSFSCQVDDLPAGVYLIHATCTDKKTGVTWIQAVPMAKN